LAYQNEIKRAAGPNVHFSLAVHSFVFDVDGLPETQNKQRYHRSAICIFIFLSQPESGGFFFCYSERMQLQMNERANGPVCIWEIAEEDFSPPDRHLKPNWSFTWCAAVPTLEIALSRLFPRAV
jgi:hypothetical protein